jgi:dGTPase
MNENEAVKPLPTHGVVESNDLSEIRKNLDALDLHEDVRATVEARGRGIGGLIQAHKDSTGWVGETSLYTREEREEEMNQRLAPGATRSKGAGERAVLEEPDNVRTCFEKDADRIRYSTAFRRLAGKCQVFVAPKNDHLRNRLTHALETAQVALSVARLVGLNEHLVEAIAIGHDCGHGPTGHSCEEALGIYREDGFDHAPYGADITLTGLNLCAETLDGIRNHSWKRPAPMTPEGELVSLCDRISYVCHDFADASVAGIVTVKDLPEIVRINAGERHSDQVGYFVSRLASTIANHQVVALDEEAAEVLDAFRTMNFERIYLRPASMDQAKRSVRLLRALCEHFIDMPGQIPDVVSGEAQHPGGDDKQAAELAVRYVSGMTDRYALNLGVELLGMSQSDLPKGV